MKPKILLVYSALTHPLRANTWQLIECFRQYGDAHWFYLNLAHKPAPSYLASVGFDLIIFQTTFTQRLSRSEAHYKTMTRRANFFQGLSIPKVALVQDEFSNVSRVERFINAFGVGTVFSVAPESEWPKLYPSVDRERVRFRRVLTGYLDDATLDRLIAAGLAGGRRKRDIVYRAAGSPSPAWGRLGYTKQLMADAVLRLASASGLDVDISTAAKDALYGAAWVEFLAGARYTIGAPSGASLLDRDGEIAKRVDAYRRLHPQASFEEVERQCFAGMDGNIFITTIGPRHIEACATRTCQILVRGDYNGLLEPDVHYISVRPDLSDLPQVIASLGDEARRKRIVERAFDDVVRPLRITYRNFVNEILNTSMSQTDVKRAELNARERRIQKRMERVEALEWAIAKRVYPVVRDVRDLIRK
jgi:hypothetical protein